MHLIVPGRIHHAANVMAKISELICAKNSGTIDKRVRLAMTEELGIGVLCLISVVVSIVLHKKIENYLIATILSVLVTITVFFAIGYLVVGHLDPYFPIAFVYGGAIALVIALFVGLPFLRSREKKKGK